jgi:hypothetical protein
MCAITAAFIFMILGMGGVGEALYEDVPSLPRYLQLFLGLSFLLFGFWLGVASVGSLFGFTSSRESLPLCPVMRARFQFIGAAFVAVEVNDLLGSIAFFGHSASPSGTIRVALVCWLATAEAPASQVASASCYRLSENVFFFSVVEPELKLTPVKRQIFFADISGILPYAKLSS